MLSIKDINEVSFRKSNFSGYNSDDVDQFIDEVFGDRNGTHKGKRRD